MKANFLEKMKSLADVKGKCLSHNLGKKVLDRGEYKRGYLLNRV